MHGGQWLFRHVSKENNKAVDYLTKMTSNRAIGAQMFDNLLRKSLAVLDSDKTNSIFVQFNLM